MLIRLLTTLLVCRRGVECERVVRVPAGAQCRQQHRCRRRSTFLPLQRAVRVIEPGARRWRRSRVYRKRRSIIATVNVIIIVVIIIIGTKSHVEI